jgi:hypothetical protein
LTLGIALVVIFALYLIDKHNRWRQVAKIVLALVVLAALGIAGFYAWAEYDDWHRAQVQKAEAQKPIDYDALAKQYGSTGSEPAPIDIHGGETLHVVPSNIKGDIPVVYLGHNQKFIFACGVGEDPFNVATVKSGAVTCP